MKKLICSILLMAGVLCPAALNAAVSITKSGGWFESAYVEWTKEAGYSYNVYVSPAASDSWTKLDNELVREYPTYGRADALGLAAGSYKMKVVPVQNNAEVTADASVTGALTVANHDRGGFAHFKTASSTFNPANGVGAYKNDGTLKSGAKVLYVTADNAKAITTSVKTGSKDTNITECTGLQTIIDAYQKGYDSTPITFRIIGTIKKDDLDKISSSAEGLQIKGKNAYSEMNITIEGVGKDATIHGFGFLVRNACSVELRNFASMWCMDDCVSIDTENCNIWVHNLDLFYGKPGSASDQVKGDGTIDMKGDSRYITVSYNHLWDSGKASLCGMKSETGPNWITYHHNWFDHSDSRHPRIRTMSVHVYNNYYDGNSKYGVGAAYKSNAFVENNYFRNCKFPMLISKQGSDVNNGQGSSADTKGTFSGEDGGMIKAYGNYMTGQKKFQPWAASGTNNTHFDAYVVTNKSDKVPTTVTALQGGCAYDNFDTDASLMYTGYTCHEASQVVGVVTGELGAGRCNHGDFSWTFGANEDTNDAVISALSTAIQNYKSTLVGFFGKTISNGGATNEQGGSSNDGTGSSEGGAGDDDGEDNAVQEETYITGELTGETMDDYYWFNEDNKEQINGWLVDGTITLVDGMVEGSTKSSFNPAYSNTTDGSYASTEHTGSLQLAKASSNGGTDGGSVIFKCPKGVTSFAVYLYRTGSQYLNVYKSTDGEHWKKVANVNKEAKGILEKDFSSAVFDKDHCVFIKIENTSTGGLNIQGIRICNEQGATAKEPTADEGGSGNGGETGGETGGGTGDTDATAIYKYTVKEIVPAMVKDGKEQNYSDQIATQGGKFVFGKVSGLGTSDIAASGYAYKLDGDAKSGNTRHAKIILDSPLKSGDKITLTFYETGGTANNDFGLSLYDETQATCFASVYSTVKSIEESATISVPTNMIGLTTFYICRNTGKSTYFTGITITGQGATVITQPSAISHQPSAIYDLQGRRITTPVKGQVYILDGKKQIKK